jgi:hypothetical protein
MTKSLANFRDLGSFIAGLLVGLSIVVPVYAMVDSDPAIGRCCGSSSPPSSSPSESRFRSSRVTSRGPGAC